MSPCDHPLIYIYWLMVRPSGTEPVLRTYAEAATTEEAFAILKDCHKELGV